VRFVAAPDGAVLRLRRDDRMRMAGRGAYVCPGAECFERAVARRGFQRAARTAGAELVIDPGLMAGPVAQSH
jgi:predicted RNA-binding protein YlxR (DUF448 family)